MRAATKCSAASNAAAVRAQEQRRCRPGAAAARAPPLTPDHAQSSARSGMTTLGAACSCHSTVRPCRPHCLRAGDYFVGNYGGAHLVQQRVVLLVVALGELLEPLEQVGLRLAAQQRRRARPPLELVEALARLPARARAGRASATRCPPPKARASRAGAAPSRHPRFQHKGVRA